MKRLFKQIISFLAVSGTGWAVDFGIYYLLTSHLGFKVAYANFISGIPSLTFVFIVSTRKIFSSRSGGLTLKQKYALYFVYQMILIFCVSCIGQFLYGCLWGSNFIKQFAFLVNHLKMIVKILITPITMTMNFIVMKMLAERV